jgi:4-amino-4-deoxy-L-arabinose transferase-like glycosyltransferase
VVVLVALAFRLSFALRIAPFVSKDSQSYFLPAWDLVHGGDFQLGLRRTPGYPGFVALALILFGDDLRGVVLAQHFLGAVTAGLTYALGRLTFGRVAGLAAGLLVAVSAPLLAYEHYVLTEALFGVVLTAALTGLVAAWRLRSARLWLLGGLLVGLATLVRPVGLVILPLALLAAAIAPTRFANGESDSRHRSLVNTALVLLGFAALIVPWTIRNQLTYELASPSTFGRTLIARTAYYDRGFVYYDAAQPSNDPDVVRLRGRQIIQQGSDRRESDGTIAQRLRQELDLDPVGVNALMRNLAMEAIVRQPAYFLEGTLRFGIRIFDGIEIRLREHESERRDVIWEPRTSHLLPSGSGSEDDFRAASRLLVWYQPARFAPIPLILFVAGSVSALVARRWRPALVPAVAVLAIVLASAALDGPQERYRYPADPAISVMVAGGVVGAVALARVLGQRLRLPRNARLTSSPHPSPLPGGEGA